MTRRRQEGLGRQQTRNAHVPPALTRYKPQTKPPMHAANVQPLLGTTCPVFPNLFSFSKNGTAGRFMGISAWNYWKAGVTEHVL